MVLRSKLALLWGAAIMLLTVLVSSGVALAITYGQPSSPIRRLLDRLRRFSQL